MTEPKDPLITGLSLTAIDAYKRIIQTSKSQSEIVSRIADLESVDRVDVVRNPALNNAEIFDSVPSFATSLHLALRSRSGMESITFMVGHYDGSALVAMPVKLNLSLTNSNRKEIADEVAAEFVSRKGAIGFTLNLSTAKAKTTPSYQFVIFENRGKNRNELYLEDSSRIKEALAKIEEASGDTSAETYRAIIAKQEELNASKLWDPYYLVANS